MIILGIETSCDETALAVVEAAPNVCLVSEALISQIKVHEKYGGVFPMLAKREHGKNLIPLLHKVLTEAGQSIGLNKDLIAPDQSKVAQMEELLARETELLPFWQDFIKETTATGTRPAIDAIAVTEGPGLEPALWVGVSFAKALGLLWGVPVIPTNHMEGHIVAPLIHGESAAGKSMPLHTPALPAIALLVSGGHTELVLMEKLGSYKIIGQTRDDAVGEAFDKVARLLGLPYPGGPEISRMAAQARIEKTDFTCTLPRPMIHSKDLDFSFSGLKTAVLYFIRDLTEKSIEITDSVRQTIAREFEDSITEVLVKKTEQALDQTNAQSLIVGGGVSANTYLCQALKALAKDRAVEIFLPEKNLSTDNAIMIAVAGSLHLDDHDSGNKDFVARGNLSICTP